DGITESIINTLSQFPKLRVVARSTVFRYKDQQIDPQEAGRLFDVQAVLTGRVRQIADRLIISTELIDIATDSQLWGEHYNRNLSDIFEVQEEIAREIAEKLRLKLNRKEKARLGKRHTHKVEAYQAYLKGRYHWNKRTTDSLKKGVEYFKQAIDRDPAYASAYAGLSDSYTLLIVREAASPEEGFAKAKAAASMALKIDEEFAEAHASLGHAMLHNWEWGDGEKELKRAIELNPGYASAHHWYSEHLTAMGRCDESITELKLAGGLDPLSLVISADLGRAFYYAREYDQVMKQESITLEMDPNFWLSHINLGKSYTQLGIHADAISELKKAVEFSLGNTEALSFLGFAYAAAGQGEDALRTLHELDERSKRGYVPPYHLAIVHAGLGQKDQAFGWLEQAFEKHAVDLFTLKVEPMFDSLRSDERFEDLLRRVGLASPEPYLMRTEVSYETRIKKKAIAQPKPAAIAVLPFRPISTEGRDEILELGIADALITRLSDIKQIIVRPTSLIRKYIDLEQDSATAGREMAVESVLEGNIQKLGDRIRITARLIKVEDGSSLWAGTFDEEFTDIFAVEDSISEKVTAALALKLTGEDRDRLKRRYTENTAAYHLYLKGRYFWNKRTEEALNRAIECFNQAIELDPNYALPYAGLADCYTKLGDVGVTAMTPGKAFARAHAAASRALTIDSSLAEVHASLGHIDMHLFQWADAERAFKHAIELNPNYATAHQWYAYYMAFHQRFDEALEKIKVALKLDPLSLPIADSVGEFLYFARRNDEAIEEIRKTLEMDPNFLASHINLGRAYAQTSMFCEAEDQFAKARQIAGESIDALAALGHTYAMSGNNGSALEVLAQLTELSKERYVSPYDIALIRAALGETDEAFRWLEKAYDERVEWMI
ncbi:MAG: tetratricopeptide repeat protein, partial [Acidobacteria bacterium]|nr:tetratricopeptide repeat protein [Acidobacteriota bacterium]